MRMARRWGVIFGFLVATTRSQAQPPARLSQRTAALTPPPHAALHPLDAALPDLENLYKHLHSHPELSLHERETAARMAKELSALGFEVTTGVGGTGVVGLLKNGPGPTVLVRTDLDALPVTERTNR